jgi:hypothetical protein
MDAAILVAVIALVGALVSAAISVYGQMRSTRLAARREAEAVLFKYREPLVAAAYELQSRLYNILELAFLPKYLVRGDEAQKMYAVGNTLYVVAQYFGWSEILRREIQFLSFSDVDQTRAVLEQQRRVLELFQSDDPELGRQFLVWRGEQRAIGECMIDRGNGEPQCLGYASFVEQRDSKFGPWLTRLEGNLEEITTKPNRRLVELQHALVDLIDVLDPQHVRYSEAVLRKV